MNALALPRRDVRILTPGPTPIIQTALLTLRPHRLSDADAITESLSDFAVTRMLARVPTPYDRQDALDWLVQHTAGLDSGWDLAVTEKDDVHIGMVGIDLRHGRWHLGYWLNRYYWRRGIMGEAVGATLERFARRMPDVAVFSGIFADNPASLKLQQKLGFEIIGCSEVYSFARNTMVPHIETVLKPGALRLSRPA
ncbi:MULTISPECIES: GNAT family N-acetyltransferase [Rhizobium]|uniref:Acetyltransferase protein n=1 Tax=Rhizobium rhizogenes (strain K84 / ATCC BAA-868) TaxID=311403 RepID=B9JER0_RHIR8|nr:MULTISPECIES: GNAT family N-acetyltransferase [Rhizobium]ACM28479.1 acetyltransferase protein [Rhizobium rhizogenes K84]OCJ23988.1 acetyltransferase [Agrobacterium sp. B131/95]EJK80891.1 acetyltransferase, ribosomal protein N-acetylase [Rhizobium sp. AP16]NTG09387.1 GNAT family N-acetyltransferase [Rhizobium rhizogenes]NTI76004.1 GNAT family N-acetyltransferase [Rhizobium rhizogenes]